MRRMLQEEYMNEDNSEFMLRLSQDIRENIKLVNELMIGTPVIAKIKERIQQLEEKILGRTMD